MIREEDEFLVEFSRKIYHRIEENILLELE